MFTKVICAHVNGINALKVDVEVDIGNAGLPSFTIVGLADGAVRESRERVRSALKNIGYNIFMKPITINLAPADLKKEGSHYDLPLAVGLISAHDGDVDLSNMLIAGELSLDGTIRGISGVLCMCAWAKESGINKVIVPTDNYREACLIDGIEIYGFDHISALIGYLKGILPYKAPKLKTVSAGLEADDDFRDVRGQYAARRMSEIAAAGMHNMLMIGSPGSGKTMIARRIPSILPPMTKAEALITTKIHSVAGLLRNKGHLINERPYISPHHTASNVAVIGGGAKAMPGHVSIATNGVLFLDELLEFNRSVLEVLRQPLEDGMVTIARAGKTVTYPASFMLIAASNPCPCGYFGDPSKECVCPPGAVDKYRSRLSGPLLDRIDLHINMFRVEYSDINDPKPSECSSDIRERVMAAHEIQINRFEQTGVYFNSQMNEKHMRSFCNLENKASKLLENAMDKFSLSARSYNKILKTSRTIADLAGSEGIKTEHIAEALQYRILDKK